MSVLNGAHIRGPHDGAVPGIAGSRWPAIMAVPIGGASTGLDPAERSDDWIAVAISADGQERRFRAAGPAAALTGLADSLEPDSSSDSPPGAQGSTRSQGSAGVAG